MKNILYYIIIFISIGLVSISCSKDWLEIEQPGAQPVEGYYSNDEECLQATAAIYAQIQRQYASTGFVSPRMLKEAPADIVNAGGGHIGDQAWFQQLNLYINTESTPNMHDIWRAYYYSIYRANVVIEKVNPAISDNTKAMVGEAYALRAYLYFELVNMFGEVPIVIKEQTDPNEYLVEKSPVSEVYSQIEADLTEAISFLPVKQIAKWRVARGFAQTMLAKAYMFQDKRYDDALDLLEEVITSGEYSLLNNFDDVTHVAGEWGSESMFELGFTGNTPYGNGFPWGNVDQAESSINIQLSGPRDFNGGLLENLGGWGFQNPTEWAYNMFDPNDPRRDMSIRDFADWEAEYYAPGGVYETYIAAQAPGYVPTSSDSIKWDGWVNKRWQIEGYIRMKYDSRKSERYSEDEEYTAGTNERIMRYGEVLLLAAEAAIKSGDPGAGAGYIDDVRQRAGYNNTATGTMAEIEYERLAELAFEGHRWYDLKRWGKIDVTLKAFSEFENEKVDAKELNSPKRTYEPKHAYFPIPIEEMQSNPNLTQNAPW